jgi:integrase
MKRLSRIFLQKPDAQAEDSQESEAEGQVVLTWDQLRAALAKATRRDRLIILLDMTEALRPSELFAIRWRTYDDANTLDLTETKTI